MIDFKQNTKYHIVIITRDKYNNTKVYRFYSSDRIGVTMYINTLRNSEKIIDIRYTETSIT